MLIGYDSINKDSHNSFIHLCQMISFLKNGHKDSQTLCLENHACFSSFHFFFL